VKIEKVPLLPSKAPFSKRFEDAVGEACESAPARQVARRFGLSQSTVRAIDLRSLEQWAATRWKPALRQMGVDEIHLGGEAEIPDGSVQLGNRRAAVVWEGTEEGNAGRVFPDRAERRSADAGHGGLRGHEPYRLSIEQHAPNCRIVYDKFHVLQHANAAVDEVRRAQFFRKGGRHRGLIKGKRWLLLTRWWNLSGAKRQDLNTLFLMNRKLLKAYLLKESLARLWFYRYEGAMLRYLQNWINQLRWQRLRPFQKLALILDHLDGILNYCRTKIPLGVVEAVNGNIKSLLRRGSGYKNLRYLLLKSQRMAALKTELVVMQKAA
jgi:transposase